MKGFSVKINGEEGFLNNDKNLLSSLLEKGYDIPHLCYHKDIEKPGGCNLCLIEVNGEVCRACDRRAEEGMDIITESEELHNKIKKNLEEVLKKHQLKCNDCIFFQKCTLLELAKRFQVRPGADNDFPVLKTGSTIIDQSKCIGCGNCASVCPVNCLQIKEERVDLSREEDVDCVNCGQCITHCPVGCMKGEGEFGNIEEIKRLFKEKTVVVQFAPSIRTSIGEEFGMEAGAISTGKLVSALRESGFRYVFDTAAGADFTTIEEAEELLGRLAKKERLPAMSSCCPAWVKLVEFNYPQFIDNLCTSRPPQIILGTVIKEYWSSIEGVNPEDIFVVSVMPCIAKKEEIKKEELKVNGRYPVDMVITTREAARIFKNNKIDFKNIEDSTADAPLGNPSGAGVIYGSSGGVFESALRTALKGEEINVEEIRGQEGEKKKEIRFGDKVLRVRVVSGIKNAIKALEETDTFDALEVMACPGGCVGGGGQPVPADKDVIAKRSAGLYTIDENKEIKCAHENKDVLRAYEEFFNKNKEMLHTSYKKRNKTEIEDDQ